MGHARKRTPAEWFDAAEQWYLEGHQGCVNCGDRHCVFRTQTERLIEFYCYSCDFFVCRQLDSGRCFVSGDGQIHRPNSNFLHEALEARN